KLAVIGCIVNGPGESKHCDIGISLPGTGEQPAAPGFIDGQKVTTLRGEGLADEFKQIVEDYVARRYGGGVAGWSGLLAAPDKYPGGLAQRVCCTAVAVERGTGFLGQVLRLAPCRINAEQRDERSLPGLAVLSGTFADLRRVAFLVEQVVGNLEG